MKRGGRESGNESGNVVASVRTHASNEPRHAAANPAAPAICDHERGLCNHWDMQDRIRALEAELAALRKTAIEGSWRARAEKAEAELAEYREMDDLIWMNQFKKAEARAEKAEARVRAQDVIFESMSSTCPKCHWSFYCYRTWAFCPSCGEARGKGIRAMFSLRQGGILNEKNIPD